MMTRDLAKKMKDFVKESESGEFQKAVDTVPEIKRMWDSEEGNLIGHLPKDTLYELVSSYCLPFLFYKQVVIRNRDLIVKHTEMAANKMESINTNLPESIQVMRKLQLELPNQIQTSIENVTEINKRLTKIQKMANQLEEFTNKLSEYVEKEIGNSNTVHVIKDVQNNLL